MSVRNSEEPSGKEPWRAPAWVVPILCTGVGYVVAGIPGAILAGLLGVGVWVTRG